MSAADARPTGAADAGTRLAISRRSIVEIAMRRGRRTAFDAVVRGLLDIEPPAPGRSALGPHGRLFAAGPDVWWAIGPSDRLAEKLAAIPEDTASTIDLSSAFVVLTLSGRAARATLARMCRVDLHPRAFPVGASARTLMAQIPVAITLADDAPTFELLAPSTLARAFRDALAHAAPDGIAIDGTI